MALHRMLRAPAFPPLFALLLAGCAGGANLYSQPVAGFARAVDDTAQVVGRYAALERANLVDATVAKAAQGGTAIDYAAQDCVSAKTAEQCVLTLAGSTTPLLPAAARGPAAEVVMMRKLQVYARLLVDIAGAASEAELKQRENQAQTAYGDLWQGVKDAKAQDFGAAKTDLKAAVSHGLGSLYLENKRVELLAALVKSADPVVAAASDTLQSFMSDMQTQFAAQQNARLGQVVANFDVLSTAYAANVKPLDAARYQTLRRAALREAVRDIGALRVMLATDPVAAFAHMKSAHQALVSALTLADSDLGKALVAIENFSAAAGRASAAFDEVKGLM